MIDYFGIENILYFFLAALTLIGFQIERFARRTVNHQDKLRERVEKIEKYVGLKEDFDMDPLGFVRNEEDEEKR